MSNNTQILEGTFLIYKSQSQHWETQSFTFSCHDSWPLEEAVRAMSHQIRNTEWSDGDMTDDDYMAVGVGDMGSSCADAQWISVGFHPVGGQLIHNIAKEDRLLLEDFPGCANSILSEIG